MRAFWILIFYVDVFRTRIYLCISSLLQKQEATKCNLRIIIRRKERREIMKWMRVQDQLPPKDVKFLFHYEYGTGLGEWNQCFTTINGNRERTHEGYILITWPSAINDGEAPWDCDEKYMLRFEMFWMFLPKEPESDHRKKVKQGKI